MFDPNYISDQQSTKDDLFEVNFIKHLLDKEFHLFEGEQDSNKRQEVLKILQECVKNAVYNMFKKNGKSENESKEAGGSIFTYGSYRLGVAGPGDDIDLLCLAPDLGEDKNEKGKCKRDDFYECLNDELDKLQKKNEITEKILVKSAHVPIIKIKINDIDVDIEVAIISRKSVDYALNLEDDQILKNCCKKCVLSLNGRRAAECILKLLPESMDNEDFNITLRVIKLWSKKRGIYSTNMGYLGGLAWAILVVKICQMFPKCKANVLIRKFFEVYSKWDFMNNPIKINRIKTQEEVGFECSQGVWKEITENNLKTYKEKNSNISIDKDDIDYSSFYIITPTFPAQNTNFNKDYNVNRSNKNILVDEFTKSYEFLKKVDINNKDEKYEYTWHNFFKEINIFKEYNLFLEIDILARNENLMKSWFGFVESRLIILIGSFNDFPQIKLRPFSIPYYIKDSNFTYCKTYLFGINFVDPDSLDPKPNKNINLREAIKKGFVSVINRERMKLIQMQIDKDLTIKDEINLRITIKRQEELPIEIIQKKRDI